MYGELKLTKELLSKGYSFDRPEELPEGVTIGRGMDKGEFVYITSWLWEQVFITPCGKQVKGITCHDGLSTHGIEYRFENNNPLVNCPFHYEKCKLQDPILNEGPIKHFCSVCHCSEVYKYEGSIEEAKRLEEIKRKEKKEQFLAAHPRVCEHHITYNPESESWRTCYDFNQCVALCSGGGRYCPILNDKLSTKKGNVFYDIRLTFTDPTLKGSLFEGEEITQLVKGNRFFKSPISLSLCERFLKGFSGDINKREQSRHFTQIFFAERKGEKFEVSIENVKIDKRESRDLLQDLQDIQDGIQVFHMIDREKAEAARKREDRIKRKEKKEKKIDRKLNEARQINLFEQLGG